jgi:hypothetical protein
VIARYKVKQAGSDEADPASGVILLTIPKPFTNHNGGKLNFGADGYLYISTGDGGSGGDPFGNAQNKNSYLGKMLRLNVSVDNIAPYYSIPAANPYKLPDGLPEVLAIGLRNPWRWSFDRKTGDIWIADVGQDNWEEVDMRPADSTANQNYGWNCFEGTHPYNINCNPGVKVGPLFEYPHNATGGFSITGGYVYRGTAYPALQGYFICNDFYTGNGWLISPKISGGWNISPLTGLPIFICSYGESSSGELYAVAIDGKLYKLSVATTPNTGHTTLSASAKGFVHQLHWEIDNQSANDVYVIQRSLQNNTGFTEIGRVNAATASSHAAFDFSAGISVPSTYYYRVRVFAAGGNNYFSNEVNVSSNDFSGIKAWIADERLQVWSKEPLKTVVLTDASGRVILMKQLPPQTLTFSIPVSSQAKGIMFCRVSDLTEEKVFKLVH